MITAIIIGVFIIGYIAIAFEHALKLNKAAPALITGVLCWTLYTISSDSSELVTEQLMHHLSEIGSILFFLLGAMTIVELIDLHSGFHVISQKIRTNKKGRLLIIISVLTFFLSALLDNLTTAIVMASLTAKLLEDKNDRLWFCGMIIIAANAGGAWSPLGDVTTTMLWIGGQISALHIMKELILPSLAVCAVPLALIVFRFRKQTFQPLQVVEITEEEKKDGKVILLAGVAFLIFVPVFKTLTHLPPFMGMLIALGCMWIITSIIHGGKPQEVADKFNVARALEKIDSSSILFFLGILLAVAALQSYGMLPQLADYLDRTLGNEYLIGISLGLLSAVVDNVPLVAAAQGMYDLNTYPMDHNFWTFLALTTGTGGSAIIIGSAAGVAVMGIQKIDFMWYLTRISWLALVGFAAGILVYMIQ